jgi:hypothetical protein
MNKSFQRTVVLDLDGVLAQYSGWKGPNVIGDPYPLAQNFCRSLINKGWKVVVQSCRHPETVDDWLREHNFPEEVSAFGETNSGSGKYVGAVYVDDHAERHNGDFTDTIKAIENHRAWWDW